MLGFYGRSQNSLEGIIKDANQDSVLESVDIYFPKLEKGAVSDENGKFRINGLPTGNYKIVVS